MVRAHLPITWILSDIPQADDPLSMEGACEHRRRPRIPELLELLAWRSGERVEREHVTLDVAYGVKERAELRAAELRRCVRHRLNDASKVEVRGESCAGPVQQFENARLLLECLFGLDELLLGTLTRMEDTLHVLQCGRAQQFVLVVGLHQLARSSSAAKAVPRTRAAIFANAISRVVDVSSLKGEKPQSSVVPS